MHEIDKNTPIPLARSGRFSIYPFGKLEIGVGTILVECDIRTVAGRKKLDSAKSASRSYGKRHGKKFRTHQEDNGVRIWRIEVEPTALKLKDLEK